MSNLEAEFLFLCRALGLPEPEREYRFDPVRKWRFDFCWPAARLSVECEGGVWMKNGRHTTGKGYSDDAEKYNAASLAGFLVLRFTADMLRDGRAEATLRDARGIIESGV